MRRLPFLRSSSLRSGIWLFLLCLALSAPLQSLDAQSTYGPPLPPTGTWVSPTVDWDASDFYTPTPVPQTPTPVSDPDGDGEGCPDVPVLSDDVTPLYARECRRCVDDLEDAPVSQLQIPTRRISTPVAGGDYVFGTATTTSIPVTNTPSPSPTATITPDPTGYTVTTIDFEGGAGDSVFSWAASTVDYAAAGGYAAGLGYGGSVGWVRNGTSYVNGFSQNTAWAAIRIDFPENVIVGWVAPRWSRTGSGGTFQGSVLYVKYQPSVGALVDYTSVGTNAPGYPTYSAPVFRYFNSGAGMELDYLILAANHSMAGESAVPAVHLDDIAIAWKWDGSPPTTTPSPTPVTHTPTPSPTLYWGIRTPVPSGESIDCRVPLWRDKTPIFRLPELKVIGSACYRVVPLIDLDLSSYSIPFVDTSWVPPVQVNPVDLCVTWQLIGDFAFMGMSVPFDILFALPLLAFLWRLLYRF